MTSLATFLTTEWTGNTYPSSSEFHDTVNSLHISPRGIFRVHSYSPKEGESGVPLSATLECLVPHNAICNPLSFRLVIGRKAIRTEVEQVPKSPRFMVKADVPPIHMHGCISSTVGLVVQAMDGNGHIIDSALFGHFTYWESGLSICLLPQYVKASSAINTDVSQQGEMSGGGTERTVVSTSNSSGTTAMSRTSSDASQVSHTADRFCRRRRLEKGSSTSQGGALRRRFALPKTPARKGASPSLVSDADVPTLDIASSIDTIWLGWSEDEVKLGRRLVKFTQVRTASQMLVSCEAIRQDEYQEGAIVISCIRRTGTDTYHVSSVDVLYLVENIVGEPLTTDEKNRLRRNIECYKPLTVSKLNPDTKEFFQQLMDFPIPQPRNIEKDLKVFEWRQLKAALLKVLSKYSLGGSKININPVLALTEDLPTLRPTVNHSINIDVADTEEISLSPTDLEVDSTLHDRAQALREDHALQNRIDDCIDPVRVTHQTKDTIPRSVATFNYDQRSSRLISDIDLASSISSYPPANEAPLLVV